MQCFWQVVCENDRQDGQSGAVERPDWGVGDRVSGRVFSDGAGLPQNVLISARPGARSCSGQLPNGMR